MASALAFWEDRPVVSGTPVSELRRQLDDIDREHAVAAGGGLGGFLRAIVRWLARLFRLAQRPSGGGSVATERRRRIEREIADAARAENSELGIRNAALSAGLSDGAPDELAEFLREWQQTRAVQMGEADKRLRDWEELQRLLGERTLEGLEAETVRLRCEAESRAAVADRDQLADALTMPPGAAELAELRRSTSEVRRAELQSRLLKGKDREASYQAAIRTRAEASADLNQVASGIASEAATVQEQRDALREWLDRRRVRLSENRRQRDEWDELQRLLGVQTLADLEEEVRGRRGEADSLMTIAGPEAVAAARVREPAPADLDDLDEALGAARVERDTALGELAEFENGLPELAEAEEVLEAAQAELARVQNLRQTLGTAITFLERAQERVHRDIAPVLRTTVLERLARVTGGRYVDCRVDPESLTVEVVDADGRWNSAGLLSHGTAEQLYLLLRLALAQHLTAHTGEVCPLILDDVLSAADGERKRGLLATLLAISESVQVILFTHEDDVRSWAEESLTDGRDRLTVL